MEVCCEFSTGEGIYHFIVRYKQIPENVETKFIGNHKEGITDDDVKCINFFCCKMTKIPQGLTKQFPNLEILYMSGTRGLQNISKNDLIE